MPQQGPSPAPPRWPWAPPSQSHLWAHIPAWPQATPIALPDHRSLQQAWSSPPTCWWADTPAWAWPHPHGGVPCPRLRPPNGPDPREPSPLPVPQPRGASSSQGTWAGLTNTRTLKPSAAVCTRNASNSLSKHTKQQTGSKACANSSLLLSHSYSKSH